MAEKSWKLLLFPLGILFFGFGILACREHMFASTKDVLGVSYLPWLLVLILLAAFIQSILVRKHQQLTLWLFPCVMMLSSIGIVMIARLKPDLLIPQLRWLMIGMLVYLAVLQFGKIVYQLERYQYLIGLLCIVLLSLPLLFGTEIGGSKNWLVLGSFRIQPSEFGKILLVIFLSAYLSNHKQMLSLPNVKLWFLRLSPFRFIAPLLVILSFAILMFVAAKDLGFALLFFGITVFMTYIATGNKSYVFIACFMFLLASLISYMLFGHVHVRFDIWIDPWQDPNGMAYQIVQSLFAFGSGGVWGAGFAHGHPGMIPEVHTDFIFSALAEELGLVGSLMVLLCYSVMFYEGIRIAMGCRTDGQVLLATGCNFIFFLQAFIIVAGVTKFLPLTGITLPFISYGGSSMISSFILLGIMTVLSRKEPRNFG